MAFHHGWTLRAWHPVGTQWICCMMQSLPSGSFLFLLCRPYPLREKFHEPPLDVLSSKTNAEGSSEVQSELPARPWEKGRVWPHQSQRQLVAKGGYLTQGYWKKSCHLMGLEHGRQSNTPLPTKEGHVQIPGTCGCAASHGKGDFAVKSLEMAYLCEAPVITMVLLRRR